MLITPELLQQARQTKRPIVVWAVNDEKVVANFRQKEQIIAITTDIVIY